MIYSLSDFWICILALRPRSHLLCFFNFYLLSHLTTVFIWKDNKTTVRNELALTINFLRFVKGKTDNSEAFHFFANLLLSIAIRDFKLFDWLESKLQIVSRDTNFIWWGSRQRLDCGSRPWGIREMATWIVGCFQTKIDKFWEG